MPEQLAKIIRFFLLFLALLLIQCTSLSDRQKNLDGPYIWRYPDKWKADYLYQGDYRSIEIDRSENGTGRIWLDDFKTTFYLNSAPYHAPADQYQAADKIIVISDVHGQYDLFLKILKKSGVVNRKSDWTWGRGVLVVLGDIFDRGAQVNECLWLIRKLEIQA
ncbi:MAG: metallophosphoesterase, partial [Candidatus Cloacimonetes bacterium]|nr:metallophosphoesterase [Candidatus Cloacimonadota bacterium]